MSEAAEEARSRRANLASRDSRWWCSAHVRRLCFRVDQKPVLASNSSPGSSIQIIFFFWTCSWTDHEHVQKMFKSLEISKYSQQEFEHVHEQFMNKLDNPWTVHELRHSAGVVRSTFFAASAANFFFWISTTLSPRVPWGFLGKKS